MSTARKARRAKKKAEDDGRVIVKTSRGHQGECLPISTLLDEIQAAYQARQDAIEWPMRTITDVAGSEIEAKYTIETISRDDVDEETRARYWECDALTRELDSEKNERMLRALATDGFNVFTKPDDDEWIARHEWLGMDVPEAPHERDYHYFKAEVIGHRDDAIKIIKGVYRASGVDEEVLDRMEASFRPSLGMEGTDVETDTEEIAEEETGGLVE